METDAVRRAPIVRAERELTALWQELREVKDPYASDVFQAILILREALE